MKIIMILWDNQKKSLEAGRSMVEMLGVLAIIGVLSIGSVSGYSKAMFKYKLNKQTEQLETLIYNGLMLKDNFNFTTFTYLSPYLIKLNLIPKEMLTTNENILIDSFHNNVVIYYHDNGFYAVSIYLKEDSTRYAICQNMFMIAKKKQLRFNENGNFNQ